MTTRAKDRADSDWTAQNIQRLLAAMKTSVPEEYKTCSYIGGMKTIQWQNVAFPPFSADACQAKWGEILQKIRKIRNLTELINEAEENFTNPINQVEQTSKDSLPAKPPSTGYNLFCKEQVKLIKGVSKKSISIVLAQRWKELTQNEKKEYCTRCRELKRQHAVDTRVLMNTQNSEDFLPTKPPSTGYNLFCKEQVKLIKGVSKTSYCTALAQRWKELTVNQKREYSARCQALKRQYKNDLNCCLMMEELEEEKRMRAQRDTKKITNGKAAKHRKAFAGEPRMPSRYSNHIFLKEEMKRLKNSFPNTKHRFAKINQRWKRLSFKEKEAYREKQEEYMAKYSLELKQWFQGLNPQEQKEYLRQNPSKCQYLNCINIAVHEELIHRPSDSEDEEITDDSSTDDLYFDSIESEEEEEEDMDMPFMF